MENLSRKIYLFIYYLFIYVFIYLFVAYLKTLLESRILHSTMIGYTKIIRKWKETILVYK